jgi:hypothetical protein
MTEPLGPPGETCRECHSPLATDQRYCLVCGARRGDPRVPVPGVPRTTARAERTTTTAAASAGRGGAVTAVAGVATLVLAMGVGVLIGRAGHQDAGARVSAPPQVISVSGAAAAPGAAASTGAAAPSAAPKAARPRKASRRSPSAATRKAKATNPALKNLSKTSPKDYSKQSKKLPKELGTGGKAPPKDNKTPAAGGSFQNIG